MSASTLGHVSVHVRFIRARSKAMRRLRNMLLAMSDTTIVTVVGVAAFALVMLRFG